jgi:extradiol dioxygenase family protein
MIAVSDLDVAREFYGGTLGLKTVDGIANHESGARGGWFKDPDGNILEVSQYRTTRDRERRSS